MVQMLPRLVAKVRIRQMPRDGMRRAAPAQKRSEVAPPPREAAHEADAAVPAAVDDVRRGRRPAVVCGVGGRRDEARLAAGAHVVLTLLEADVVGSALDADAQARHGLGAAE